MDLLNDPIIKPAPYRPENCPGYIELLFYTRDEGAGDKIYMFANYAYSLLAKLGTPRDTGTGAPNHVSFPQNIFVPTYINFSIGNLTSTPAERPGFPIADEAGLQIYSAQSIAQHLQSNAYIVNEIEAYLSYNSLEGTVASSPSNWAWLPINVGVIQQNMTGDMHNNSGVTLHPDPAGVPQLFHDPNPGNIYYSSPAFTAKHRFFLGAQTSLVITPPAGYGFYNNVLTSEHMLVRLRIEKKVSNNFIFE